MKKSLSAVTLALAIAFGSATAAHANTADYPAPEQSVTISDARVTAGESVVVTASGLEANEEATVDVAKNQSAQNTKGEQSLRTAANAQGVVTEEVTFKKPGRHWVTVTGDETGVVGTASIVVTGGPGAAGKGPEKLDVDRSGATTETDAAVLWGLGGAGLLLVAGAAGAVALRRRNS